VSPPGGSSAAVSIAGPPAIIEAQQVCTGLVTRARHRRNQSHAPSANQRHSLNQSSALAHFPQPITASRALLSTNERLATGRANDNAPDTSSA